MIVSIFDSFPVTYPRHSWSTNVRSRDPLARNQATGSCKPFPCHRSHAEVMLVTPRGELTANTWPVLVNRVQIGQLATRNGFHYIARASLSVSIGIVVMPPWNQHKQPDNSYDGEHCAVIKHRRMPDAVPKQASNQVRHESQ